MPLESSHEKIARRAYELWQAAGCPEGTQDEHWFDAERELMRAGTAAAPGTADETIPEDASPAANARPAAEQQAVQAELQKQAARAPQTPRTHAPKPTPAPPGKPIWSKPHSS